MGIELNAYLNPELPLVVVDSASDPIWRNMIPALREIEIYTVKDGDALPPLRPGLNWIDFPENLGHPSTHGVDGWGRAFCRGIEIAIAQNYDYVVNIESDLLFRPKVMEVLQIQQQKQIKFMTAWERTYGFMENCICFMETRYLRDHGYIEKYGWHEQKKGAVLPEQHMENILRDELFIKPWMGFRDDFSKVQPEHLPHLDYLTHAHDHRLYYLFMQQIMPSGWQPPSQR
ncbi:MAG TPA: hypothetical protein PKW15_02830, partial [Alphaproteobacteria bacterium]|nr:hypothetical protein [Alphaproteobacteria bacterium]